MGALEITMTIKCGDCITHSNYSLKRDVMDDILLLADTINNHHMGYFEARQTHPDEIYITCTQCGHEDELSL
ncbi:hypothetical protein NXG04_07820 [Klebsiella pneumoniae]|nr:hypothetical protein [Klebsiella pneumoniae]MDS7714462.1 hypothetical protein [Klebsiella pneumoniae]